MTPEPAKSPASPGDSRGSSPTTGKPTGGNPSSQRSTTTSSGSAAGVLKGKPTVERQKAVPIDYPPTSGSTEEGWLSYFEKNRPHPASVAELAGKLHKDKKYNELIWFIEAALVSGQSQPWMYEVLALTMRIAGRPQAEVDRVLLSVPDFGLVTAPNMTYTAAFLTRFGSKARALSLYRQASELDPTAQEPYALGLKLAKELNDVDGIIWGVAGTLTWVWPANFADLHKEAEALAVEFQKTLRQTGRAEEADRLTRAVGEAKQRDLLVDLTWNGTADLDMSIEEPAGTLCSIDNQRTTSGGLWLHDGYGPDQKNTYERYLCPRGFAGDYRVRIRHVVGDIVGKRAVLKITRYQGTAYETEESHIVMFDKTEKVYRVTLHRGRLKEPVAVPPAVVETARRGAERWRPGSRQASEAQQALAEFLASRSAAAMAPVGYQPVISVLSEGVTLSGQAVISGDRRYVRLTLAPVFSTLTDVFTFSFINGGGGGGAGGGAGGAGGAGGFGGVGGLGGFGGVGGLGGFGGVAGGIAGAAGVGGVGGLGGFGAVGGGVAGGNAVRPAAGASKPAAQGGAGSVGGAGHKVP